MADKIRKIDFRTEKLLPGKLGLIRHVDPRDFKLSKYLSTPLPAPKPGPLNRTLAISQGMMLNDALGDCVCACSGHMVLNWSAIASGVPARANDDQIEDVYCRACGYVRGDGSTDNGCSLNAVLNYMRQYGISVGNDPVSYKGTLLSGTFQNGEDLICQNADPVKLTVKAFNSRGQEIPPSVLPVWALNSVNEQQVVSPDGLTDTITGADGSVGQLSVRIGAVAVGPFLISIAKDTGIFRGMQSGNLLVASEIHPFLPGDVIVGKASGAKFQVAADNVSIYPVQHRIFAYVSTATQGPFMSLPPSAQQCMDEIKLAIDMFGGSMIGVELMTYVQGQTLWDVQSGTTLWGDHCVWAIDYDSEGIFFVSWGRIMKMTWAFFLKYVFQNMAAVSRDWISPTSGMAPSGFNLAQLTADLSALANIA